MAEEKDKAASEMLSGGKPKAKKPKGKKKLKGLHIRKAKSGGFIVRHEHTREKEKEAGDKVAEKGQEVQDAADPEMNEEHVVPDVNALKEHIAQALQSQGQGGEGGGGGEEAQAAPQGGQGGGEEEQA